MMKLVIRPSLAPAGIFALYGLVRYLDGLIRIFLRQATGESLPSAVVGNWRTAEAVGEIVNHMAFGLCLWVGIVLFLMWFFKRPIEEVAWPVALGFAPLVLSGALTAVAALSLSLSPYFPYGLNLALTMCFEGAFSTLLVWGLVGVCLAQGVIRLLGPLPTWYLSPRAERLGLLIGGWLVVIGATATFAAVTPSWIWKDGAGQGNMFKYVRMAAAVANSGSLNIENAEGAAENATFTGFVSHLPRMARSVVGEAAGLMKAVLSGAKQGEVYVGSVKATKGNRSMFRSHKGGTYYINAPGPGLLLVPAYLLDRALNRTFEWDLQIAVILFWILLGALLVLEMIRIARIVEGSWSPAFIAAALLAASTPIWLYTFQIYPELPAALGLLYAFRKLLMEESPSYRGVLAASLALAFLPWLHQKYSVAAAVLGLMAAVRLVRDPKSRSGVIVKWVLLFGPLVISAFSIFLYTHSLTGSLLPDATFRAVGRTSFDPRNMARGLLGLLFDRENGLFVFAPVYLLSLGAVRILQRQHSRLYTALLVVVVSYMVIIASFPYWPGAVSSVARYILSVSPFAVLLLVFVIRRSFSDGVLAGVVVTFSAASLAISRSFHEDIVQSYNPDLLLSRVLYCDPLQYLPNFLSEGFFGSGPAHFAKLVPIVVGLMFLVLRLSRRVEQEPVLYENDIRLFWRRALFGASGTVALVILMGAILERVPSNSTKKVGPEFRDTRPLRPRSDMDLAVAGEFGFEKEGVWVPGGATTRFLISSPSSRGELRLELTNVPRRNSLLVGERGARAFDLELGPSDHEVRVIPLKNPYVFRGPKGNRYIYSLTVRSRSSWVPSRDDESEREDNRRLGCYVVWK